MVISNRRGNVLLFVISGIAMIATIGMGMFYMSSTSSLGQVGGDVMNRAYYLALAGRDYATANWNIRSQLTGNEFTVSNTERFSLSIDDFRITSTGIVNKDTPFEARKTIKAPSPSFVRKAFFESFEDLTKWATGTQVGGHAIATVSGDKALDVTSTQTGVFGTRPWSFIQLNTGSSGANINLTSAWQNAGYYLGYDLQIKVLNNQPYYMAGLNFKVANSGVEFYGVSYTRRKELWDGTNLDNMPNSLKPSAIFDGTSLVWDGSTWVRYSKPALILWKRKSNSFSWLAYKLLSSSDFTVDGSGLLVDWSNLQVRSIEASPLNFTNGGPTPLLHGASVVGENSGASARISGSPILTSGSWESGNAAGTLTLSNICIPCPPALCPNFQSGENLRVNDKILAKASGTLGAKSNYIRVYYGDVNSHGTPNTIPTDNDNRGSNPRIITGSSNIIHWPVDNVSDWSASNDYMTLVSWNAVNTAIVTNPPVKLTELIKINDVPTFAPFDTIIQDISLTTTTPPDCYTIPSINYSGIALHATGNSATATYFDDFAIQY